MHITQLEYFLAVARTNSISKAAEELFVSQSAVSKQILLLEKELGFSLFDRGFRQIRITDGGREVLQCLLRCQQDFTGTLDFIRFSTGRSGNSLRVGYVEYWDPNRVSDTIERRLHEKGAELHLSMEPYRVSEMADVLRRGNVDLMLSFNSAFPIRDGLTIESLGTRNCGMLYSVSHFSPEGKPPERSAFSHIPVLETDDTSNPYRQELRLIMEKYGFNNPLLMCPRFSSMLAQMLDGKGIFLVSDWSYLCNMQGLGFYALGKSLPICAAYLTDAILPEKLAMVRLVVETVLELDQAAPGPRALQSDPAPAPCPTL